MERKVKKLQKDLDEERMATKVIERLGSTKPSSKRASKPSKSKTADQIIDEIEAGPEKIHVPEGIVTQKITETAREAI